MREDLIKGEEMLEVEKYPTITFKSKRIEQKDVNNYVVHGDLTMRGITKESRFRSRSTASCRHAWACAPASRAA